MGRSVQDNVSMKAMTADEVKKLLGLMPHPREGGWYVRSWEAQVAASCFSDGRYAESRRTSTAIYYLLEPGTFSAMHRLASDEIFHHYLGGAVEMLQLLPGGLSQRVVIGPDLAAGQRPQQVVPRGVWQGSRLLKPEGWALLGCTVSPGFEYADYTGATAESLIVEWPQEAEGIRSLTGG
jgi:predicted cupin superfamily sugar epimerase